jgi:DNA-nicking Smr family endonuclease
VFYGTTDEEFSLVEKEDKEAEEMEKREEQPTTQDLINKAQEQPRPRKVLRVYNAKNNTYEYKDQTSNIFREEIQLFDDEDFSKYFREKTEETIFNLTQNDNFLTFEDFSHNLQIVIDLSKKNDEQAKEMLKAFL